MPDTQDHLTSIVRVLSTHPEGLMVKNIAAALGLNRNATAQYLGILLHQGKVGLRHIGKAKVFALSKRAPFELLAEICPDYLIGIDRNLHAVDANAGFYAWSGCTREDINAKPIRSLPVPLLQQNVPEELARAGFSSFTDMVKLTCPKQDLLEHYEIRSIPVVFPDNTTGSALLIKDITFLETATETIALLEERYQALAEAQTEFIVRSLPDRTILSANPAFAAFTGIPCGQLIGTKYWPRVPEEDRPAAREQYRSISPEKPEQVIEHRILGPTGEYRWIRWRHRAIFREGAITEIHSHGTDITELVAIQKRLRYLHENTEVLVQEKTDELKKINQDLLREIRKRKDIEKSLQKIQFCVNNSSDMIFWTDEHGVITSSNKSALSILGKGPGDRPVFFQPSATGQPVPLPWQQTWRSMKQDGFVLFETLIQDRNARMLPVEVLGNFLFFDDSETCCFFIRDITERREAEDRLRLLEISVNNAYDEVFWMDMKGNILYVNDAACRTLGYSREELCALKIFDLVPGSNPEGFAKHIANVRKNRTLFFQSRHRCRDGTVIDVEIGTVYVTKGEEEYKICFVRDITERKRAEDRLNLLKTSVDNAYDEVFWMDTGANILYVNDAVCMTTGFSREELCGTKIFFLDPDFTQELWARSLEGLRKNRRQYFQTRHRCRDGRILDMDIGLVYVTQGEGEFVFCFARNITERIQMVNALVESAEMLRNTIDAMSDAVYIADKWNFIYLNPAALQLFGASSITDLAEESLRNRVRSDYHELIRQRAQSICRDRHPLLPCEMVFIRLDGSEIDVETSAMPFRYQGKDVTLVCVRDISEKKRILRALKEGGE